MQNQPESFMAAPAPDAARQSSPESLSAASPDAMLNFCGVLRELRAEAQNLNAALVEIRKKSDLEDADVRATEIKTALESAQGVFQRNRQRINESLHSVRQIFSQDPVIFDWCSDEVTHIENCWEGMGACWPQESQGEDRITQNIDAAVGMLGKLIYLCGRLTIPPRVNDHLQALRIGQALDFHKNFKDELENRPDRVRLLGYLADHPNIVTGVVNAENGVIYRASRDWTRRMLSYGMLLAAIALGFALLFVMTSMDTWLGIENWKPAGRFSELATAYVFLLLGGVTHLLVDSLKQARENTGSGLVAVQDWLLWLHVKESALLMAVIYIWVGSIALAFSMTGIQWATAFFVGYSIDSFVDIFLRRFSERMSAETELIRDTLVGAAEP